MGLVTLSYLAQNYLKMKLKFWDLLLAFGIRDIEQLWEVFLWFGFINDTNFFRSYISEVELGNKPEADRQKSNPFMDSYTIC